MKKLLISLLFLPALAFGQVSKPTIKGYFQTGDKPTQAQFYQLIDSYDQMSANAVYVESSSHRAATGTSDAAAFSSAFADAAYGSSHTLIITNTLNLSALPTLNSTQANGKIIIKGIPGVLTFNFGSKDDPFIELDHNGWEIEFHDVSYTGGVIESGGSGPDAGFHLVYVDKNNCTQVSRFVASNLRATDSYAFATFDWNGESGILDSYELINVRLKNLAYKGFTHSGLQGKGIVNGLYIDGCQVHGFRGGDETIRVTDAKYTDPNNAGFVDISDHMLNMSNVHIENVTGASQANGIQIQGWQNVNLSDVYVFNCNSTDFSDAEGVYLKVVRANLTNITAGNCLAEANINIKGGSPSGAATPSKGVQASNLLSFFTEEFKQANPSYYCKGLMLRGDDLFLNNVKVINADQPINIFSNPGDLDNNIRIRGIYIDGFVDEAIYVQGSTGWSLDLQGVIKNSNGLELDTRTYLIEETNCNFRNVSYDFTARNVEAGLGANSYFVKTNQNAGFVNRRIIFKTDSIGRVADWNDQVPSSIKMELYVDAITNKVWNMRSSAIAPWLEYEFINGVLVTDENSGVATIADGSSAVTVSHGLAANPGTDFVFATSTDGTPLQVATTDATNVNITRSGTTGAVTVYWRAINTVLR